VRLLTPEGRFLIDFLNRERVLAGLEPREVQERHGRRVPLGQAVGGDREHGLESRDRSLEAPPGTVQGCLPPARM